MVIFSLLAWFISNFLKKHVMLTALGVFVTCFFANASILLPSSSLLIAIEYSLIVNPIMVAFCAAAGAAIGELTGFCVGRYGGKIIPRKLYNWLHRQVKRHGYLMVFVFSALPLPVFDVVGMIAGALKMKAQNFLATCFCGKLIKFSIYMLVAQWVSMLVK